MKHNTRITRVTRGSVGLLLALAVTAPAFASGGTGAIATTAFDSFVATILAWTNGSLGIGLAIVALVIGGAIGITRGSALGAIAGVVLAAMFAWGPGIISSMVKAGSTAVLG